MSRSIGQARSLGDVLVNINDQFIRPVLNNHFPLGTTFRMNQMNFSTLYKHRHVAL